MELFDERAFALAYNMLDRNKNEYLKDPDKRATFALAIGNSAILFAELDAAPGANCNVKRFSNWLMKLSEEMKEKIKLYSTTQEQ